ncbi:hypothetical protein JCM17823_19640 [Halorubrum gandharaense]
MTRLDEFDALDRRTYLQATGAAALGTAALAGCAGRATGTLATHVTDQPADIEDFESLVVTIEGMWLGPVRDDDEEDEDNDEDADADDGEDDEMDGEEDEMDGDEDEENGANGREYIEFDEPQEADLVELQDDSTQLIDERELELATYGFLQLNVSETEGILVDGGEAEIELPGNAPLMFNREFEIREDTTTSFTADFAPVRRGQTETYVLRPVAEGIEVSYE